MKKKKKDVLNIPTVRVPPEMWEEMLKRGGGDPELAVWIWSCWKFWENKE